MLSVWFTMAKEFDYSTAPRIPPARFCEESGRWVAESRARGGEEPIIARKLRTATANKNNNSSDNRDNTKKDTERRTATTTTAATPKGPREHPEGTLDPRGGRFGSPVTCF